MSNSANQTGANDEQATKPVQSSGKVGLISLGCPKALVDSERIVTQLRSDGYEIVPTYDSADLVVVNTCGFIDEAKQESLDAIGEAMNANGKVIVTGCLGAQAETITEQHPGVLAVTGPQQYEQVMNTVHQHLPPRTEYDHRFDLVPAHGVKLTPRHYAYLKISEGCNHSCSFCIIPSMRGKLVSRPIGDVLDEAKALADAGVKELLVISQDTSAYGVDIKYRTGFWQGRPIKSQLYDLCSALGELGIWVRLHYVYPYPNVDKIIPLMAEGKVLPYLDIPLQHGSPKILKAMRRPAHTENTLARIAKWREICPDITIRSTFIVGFPGETDAEFEELLSFIEEAKLDRVGCFKYSPVEGAVANELADPVPESVKEERFNAFMATQQKISEEKLAAKINKTLPVIVDGTGETEDGETLYVARSVGDAPEIDGLVYVQSDQELAPGDRLDVTITDADAYDLWGTAV